MIPIKRTGYPYAFLHSYTVWGDYETDSGDLAWVRMETVKAFDRKDAMKQYCTLIDGSRKIRRLYVVPGKSVSVYEVRSEFTYVGTK